jgi:hypothetical protein
MEILYPHCAGLDVHKDTVVACARHVTDGKVSTQVKTFKTTTEQLIALSDWLWSAGCTHSCASGWLPARSKCYKSVKIGLQGARQVFKSPPQRSS